jgi:GNAT superfamily N-acetyltransferase
MVDNHLIRSATLADVATLADFNSAMALETESKRLEPAVVRAGVRAVLDHPESGFYLVAEHRGDVIGCLLVTYEWSDWRNGRFWWIQSVYVRRDHRRRGVFRRLYADVLRRARIRTDVCGIRLYVERDNQAAQQTYRQLGMIQTPYLVYEQEFDMEACVDPPSESLHDA